MHASSRQSKPRAAPAYSQLRDLIIRGRLAPGVRVVELDVASRLGTSRTPAREAIQRLHQEGFLVPAGSGRRTQLMVAALTLEDLVDLYSVISALEGTAARRIAGLPPTERRALGRSLKALNDRFEAIGRQRNPDFDALFERHNAFHEALVDASGTARLRALIEGVRPQVDRYEYVYAPIVGPNYDASFDEHSAIIREVRNGTGATVEAAVKANWMNSAERLTRAMERSGPRGVW